MRASEFVKEATPSWQVPNKNDAEYIASRDFLSKVVKGVDPTKYSDMISYVTAVYDEVEKRSSGNLSSADLKTPGIRLKLNPTDITAAGKPALDAKLNNFADAITEKWYENRKEKTLTKKPTGGSGITVSDDILKKIFGQTLNRPDLFFRPMLRALKTNPSKVTDELEKEILAHKL